MSRRMRYIQGLSGWPRGWGYEGGDVIIRPRPTIRRGGGTGCHKRFYSKLLGGPWATRATLALGGCAQGAGAVTGWPLARKMDPCRAAGANACRLGGRCGRIEAAERLLGGAQRRDQRRLLVESTQAVKAETDATDRRQQQRQDRDEGPGQASCRISRRPRQRKHGPAVYGGRGVGKPGAHVQPAGWRPGTSSAPALTRAPVRRGSPGNCPSSRSAPGGRRDHLP